MSKMKITSLLFSAIILFFGSCKKDTPADTTSTVIFNASSTTGAYIANEGQFNNNNASLSYYSGSGNSSTTDVYNLVNNSTLGDIAQSLTKINNKLFIVVNNSTKIEVTDLITLKKIATITGLTSPRYLLPVTTNKAYVSDLSSGTVSIINLSSYSVTGTIPITGSSEQMVYYNGKVYVTNIATSYLYVIDAATDNLTDSILIGYGGNSISIDKNNKLWVLCGGDFSANTSTLHKVNPSNGLVEMSLTFAPSTYASRLNMNDVKDELYFLNTNVYKMSINDTSLPTTEFINANGKSFYGLGYNNTSNQIYVSDAIDFQQSGRVYRYNENGTELGNFGAGISPGYFLFLNN